MRLAYLYIACMLLSGVLCRCGGESTDDERHELDTENPQPPNDREEPPTERPRITSKPDENRIASDLVGRSISEGIDEGYFDADWTYKIKPGNISGLKISNVVVDQEDLYIVEVNTKIKPGGNYYYNAKLKVNYVNSPERGWIMDEIKSLGLKVVSNGAYDSSIKPRIKNGDDFYIKNDGENNLLVGGHISARYQHSMYSDAVEWIKFSINVPPHSEKQVSNFTYDYRIDFVIRDY